MAELQRTGISGSLVLSGSVDGPSGFPSGHGAFYVSGGFPYFSSSATSEVNLSSSGGGGGGGISFDGSTTNGVLTYKDADEASVEANLTFDGSVFKVSGSSTSLEVTGSSASGDIFGVRLLDESLMRVDGTTGDVYIGNGGACADNLGIIHVDYSKNGTILNYQNGSLEVSNFREGIFMYVAGAGLVPLSAQVKWV